MPERLVAALSECDHWSYKASEAATALRGLAGVIGDGDNPINPDHLPGLAVAIELIGESLESHASDRRWVNETIAREAHAYRAGARTSLSRGEASE